MQQNFDSGVRFPPSGVTTNFGPPCKLFVKGPLTGSENFYSLRSGAAHENERKCILGSIIAATVCLGVVHKGRLHRGGGIGQLVGHLRTARSQGHTDVRNASENRLENAENRVKIGRKSRENGPKSAKIVRKL